MGVLEGKVAFITGAARGQGRSHAVRLAQEGADIIAVDIAAQIDSVPYPMATPEDLAETVKQVEALDRRIHAVQADVRDREALQAAFDGGVALLGGVDIVLANAGIAPLSMHPTRQEWFDVVDAVVTWVRSIAPGPLPQCGYLVQPDFPAVLPLDGPLLPADWTAELNYLANSDGSIVVALSEGEEVRVPVRPGLNRVFVRLSGAGDAITVRADTAALSVCLASGPVGFVAPR